MSTEKVVLSENARKEAGKLEEKIEFLSIRELKKDQYNKIVDQITKSGSKISTDFLGAHEVRRGNKVVLKGGHLPEGLHEKWY